jgi:hypothetical protein
MSTYPPPPPSGQPPQDPDPGQQYPPPPPGQQYPPPPPGQQYPPPPPGQQYPPPGQQYPPPPPGQQYPPPPPGQQYPPPGQQYPPPGQQYPPPGGQYPPPGQQPPPGAPTPSRLTSILSNNLVRVGAVAVIIVAVVVAILIGGSGSSNTQKTFTGGGPAASAPNATPFNVTFPFSWTAVPASGLAAYPGHPVAVLLRQDKTGLIVISRARSNPKLGLTTLGPTLAKAITGKFSDAKSVTSKIVKVGSGQAFYYALVRTKAGTVNALLIVPAGAVTYELNSVVPGNQPVAAREVGRIFLSFNLS